ncbi:hypothetical protein WMY93_022793 [Mugilogobius chulae]|uniref:Uncharacterized protein n=1 Tax=Mugilogobius chulae TaxID=88201 RepID=A0AAW0N7X8_9GOBI
MEDWIKDHVFLTRFRAFGKRKTAVSGLKSVDILRGLISSLSSRHSLSLLPFTAQQRVSDLSERHRVKDDLRVPFYVNTKKSKKEGNVKREEERRGWSPGERKQLPTQRHQHRQQHGGTRRETYEDFGRFPSSPRLWGTRRCERDVYVVIFKLRTRDEQVRRSVDVRLYQAPRLCVLHGCSLCDYSPSSGNVTRDVCKEQICSCNEIEGDVHIDCEKRSLTTLQHLTGPSSQFYHLLLHGNSLSRLFPNEFANFYNAVSLHLENNGLHDIVPGAFLGLQLVKRLHINNNKIRSFRKSTFLGLDDLEYLQADFNLLRDIDPAVFRDLNKLEVLILNDNLISALPINVFQHVPITHLDLRGNRIKTVPYEGVLEQIRALQRCCWRTTPGTEWLENIPHNALIGRVICEAPTRLQGSDLNETSEAELCPSQSEGADTSLAAPPTQDQTSNPAASNPRPTPYKPSKDASGPPTPVGGGSSGHGSKSRSKSRENWQLKTKPTPVVTSMNDKEQPHNMTCPQPCTCKLVGSRQGWGSTREQHPRSQKEPASGLLQPQSARPGGNNIKVIDNGTFQNLSELRWLYLDKNYLDTLLAEMFIGLVNLEYLSLEYNDIQLIVAGAFSHMPNLRVLFLNNNLLKSLPVDSFYGISLSKISLHNNYFTYLPVAGVLDQLNSIIQIDLHGNPWDCSCNIIPFKQWTEKLAQTSL